MISTAKNQDVLEVARIHWMRGEWDSLSQLSPDALQNLAERSYLMLLVAASQMQLGETTKAKQLLSLVQDFGLIKKIACDILIAGLHETLGRAHVVFGNEAKAYRHFEDALALINSRESRSLYAGAKIIHESTRFGLLLQAAKFISEQIKNIKNCDESVSVKAHIKILETEIQLLSSELSLAQQRQQLYGFQDERHQESEIGSATWKEHLKRKSVSQLGQDLWVLEKTSYKNSGFFVEFGATDGVLLSNTWLLENEFNWQGICAEPNQKFFEKLKKNRRCIVSNQYIGGVTGESVKFILADAYGGSQEFAADDSHAEKRAAYADAGHTTVVESISLDDFLTQHGAPREIDYISIDTEGSEYSILKNFPFDKWDVRFFTIEHNYTERRSKIHSLMKKNGYFRVEAKFDDWFEKIY